MIFASASKFSHLHIYLLWVNAYNVIAIAVVYAFNQKKALVGAFSVIVKSSRSLVSSSCAGQARGFRTILAYEKRGHRKRKNYYSNPSVILPQTGTPTGVAGVSNNARVLREMIGQMAALGDESGTCSDVPSLCEERCEEKCRDKKKKKRCLKRCLKKC